MRKLISKVPFLKGRPGAGSTSSSSASISSPLPSLSADSSAYTGHSLVGCDLCGKIIPQAGDDISPELLPLTIIPFLESKDEKGDDEEKGGYPRYHCLECPDFDVCARCYATFDPARHDHPFTLETEHYGRIVRRVLAGECLAQCIRLALEGFANRPLFGRRLIVGQDDNGNPRFANKYTWTTYAEVHRRVLHMAAGLDSYIRPREMMIISGGNRIEWFVADYAAIFRSVITIPIHVAFDDSALKQIMQETGAKVVVCEAKYVQRYLSLKEECTSLETIVQMEETPFDDAIVRSADGVTLIRMKDVELKGEARYDSGELSYENGADNVVPTAPTDLFSIVYTSGSTGQPKGVMHSDGGWKYSVTSRSRTSNHGIACAKQAN